MKKLIGSLFRVVKGVGFFLGGALLALIVFKGALLGGFLTAWVIGYGIVQSFASNITGKKRGHVPDGRAVFLCALALAGCCAATALGLSTELAQQVVLLGGLMVFGALFAVNSSLHS